MPSMARYHMRNVHVIIYKYIHICMYFFTPAAVDAGFALAQCCNCSDCLVGGCRVCKSAKAATLPSISSETRRWRKMLMGFFLYETSAASLWGKHLVISSFLDRMSAVKAKLQQFVLETCDMQSCRKEGTAKATALDTFLQIYCGFGCMNLSSILLLGTAN